jgi:cyclophilin family peptidyl-prolyl cis-trans isomerase
VAAVAFHVTPALLAASTGCEKGLNRLLQYSRARVSHEYCSKSRAWKNASVLQHASKLLAADDISSRCARHRRAVVIQDSRRQRCRALSPARRQTDAMAVMLQFPLGDVVVDLYDEGEPSRICESFTRLCARKYYHGCLVYQVQSGCLAQTGDPSGTGKGGCCASHHEGDAQRFIRHTPTDDRQKHDRAGLVSVASMGSSGNEHLYGSQFFFTLRDEDLDHLDSGGHVVIGEVAEGLDVLKKLGALYLDGNGRPWEDVRIQHTHVLENPFAAVECPPSPDRKPETPAPGERVTARVAYGQAKDANDGLTAAERASQEADKKARSQAEVLEMIGDLPHADVRRGAERSFEAPRPHESLRVAWTLSFRAGRGAKKRALHREAQQGDGGRGFGAHFF